MTGSRFGNYMSRHASGGWEFSSPSGDYINRFTGERRSAIDFGNDFVSSIVDPSQYSSFEWGQIGTSGWIDWDSPEHDVYAKPVYGWTEVAIASYIGDGLKDTDNWWSNLTTAARLLFEWEYGIGPSNRTFMNDDAANAFRNAWRVKEARRYFYKKYTGVSDFKGASVTNYSGKFGLKGLFNAGIDPIEQYVGSYNIDIHAIEGQMLQFTITNVTSMKSLMYGLGLQWERSQFPFYGNTRQTYIFTEPLRR